MLKTKQLHPVNNTIKILSFLILIILLFGSCSDDSKKYKENEIVVAFADEKLAPDDRIYACYRENIDIFKRLLNSPFSAKSIKSVFNWQNNDENSSNLISPSDIASWNKQIEKYAPGRIEGLQDSSIFVNEFKDRGGYFEGDNFIEDALKGKIYMISRPIIGDKSAIIFYDLSPNLNSLSGGAIIFHKIGEEWVKIASKTLVSTP